MFTALQNAILASGLTINEISQKSGIDRGTLSRFLRGERDLTLKTAGNIAAALDLSLTKLNYQSTTIPANDYNQLIRSMGMVFGTLIGDRDAEPERHCLRVQKYATSLCEESQGTDLGHEIDEAFIDRIQFAAPLHDIGKIGIPDFILLKPGRLTQEERIIMQSHTVIGATALTKLLGAGGQFVKFAQMAIDIARSHHERFDGKGYPDQLVGNAIPLSARVFMVGDVYDALRNRRVYKPSISHADTVKIMIEQSPGAFDPRLVAVFERCATKFDGIFQDNAN